jgi:hypothetical protein
MKDAPLLRKITAAKVEDATPNKATADKAVKELVGEPSAS